MSEAASAAETSRGTLLGRALAALALCLLLGFGGYHWLETRHLESTDDAFVEGTIAHLASEVPGRVVEVLVSEHERVKAGQLLVRLDDSEARARLEGARADVAAASNRMSAAEASAASADAEGRAAAIERWRTARELERVDLLASRGAVSDQELDTAKAAHDAALATVRSLDMRARAERGVLGNEAPIRQAEAALKEADIALARTQLVAPFDAIVGRKSVSEGDIVRAGQPLMMISRIEPRWVEANFKETQIGRMRPGAPATVEVDALPGYVFHGHVASFSPASGAKYALIPPEPASGNFTKVVQRVPVRIELDAAEDRSSDRRLEDVSEWPALAIGLSSVVTVDVR